MLWSDPKRWPGLPSHKSLFQLVAERLLRLRALAGQEQGQGGGRAVPPIPFYVMTSPMTDAATGSFFNGDGYAPP